MSVGPASPAASRRERATLLRPCPKTPAPRLNYLYLQGLVLHAIRIPPNLHEKLATGATLACPPMFPSRYAATSSNSTSLTSRSASAGGLSTLAYIPSKRTPHSSGARNGKRGKVTSSRTMTKHCVLLFLTSKSIVALGPNS